MTSIGRLFDSEDLSKVQLIFDHAQELAPLEKEVGTEGFQPKGAELESQTGSLTLFNQPLSLGGELHAQALIHPSDDRLSFFGDGETFKAGTNLSLAEISLTGKFQASGKGKTTKAPLSIDARGGTSGEIHYRHVIPVMNTQKRISALKRVVATSRPPQLVSLEKLVPGEVHMLQTQLKIGFGVKLRKKTSLDIDALIQPFHEFDLNLQAHIEFSIEASVGWSLYDAMTLTVGRACTMNRNPDWVRIRLDRSRRHELSLGARFNLEVQYNLASGVERLYDRALNLIPNQDAIKTFRDINSILATGNWQDIRDHLSDRGTAFLTDYLESTGWRDWLNQSPEVTEFIKFSTQVVNTYNNLDDRLQTWWTELLASADLGPQSQILAAIKKIAAFNTNTFRLDELLDGQNRQTVELLEALTGKRLEELLLDGETSVKPLIAKAQKAAQSALDFLRDTPKDFTARLQRLAKRSRITEVVNFLSQNATSKEDLETAIANQFQTRIRGLVSRLVDKAWDKIDDNDLARVQGWAKRMETLFAKKDEWNKKIRDGIERLKGEVGFSVGMEFDRLSQANSLLDLEIDPRDKSIVNLIEKTLLRGDIKEALAGLNQLMQKDDEKEDEDDQEDPFQIREAVFLSRQVRTTSLWVFFFGKQQNGGRRIRETCNRILSGDDGYRRQATYTGAYVRTETTNKIPTNEAGAWLKTSAQGKGFDLDEDYDHATSELRLTFSRQDEEFSIEKLGAVDNLLQELGFRDVDKPDMDPQTVATEPESRLAIELVLPAATIDTFFDDVGKGGTENWKLDYLNAARRWFDEPLISETLPKLKPIRLGLALAELVEMPAFREAWYQGWPTLDAWARREEAIRLKAANKWRILPLYRSQKRFPPTMNPLQVLAINGGLSMDSAQNIRQKLLQVQNRASVASLVRLQRSAARQLAKIQANKWENPMFLWWLFLARILRRCPDLLADVKGVASLRFREKTKEAWGEPRIWHLKQGIPVDRLEQILRQIR